MQINNIIKNIQRIIAREEMATLQNGEAFQQKKIEEKEIRKRKEIKKERGIKYLRV